MVGYDFGRVTVQKIVQGLVFGRVLIAGFTLTKKVIVTAVAAHHLLHHNRIFTGLFKSVLLLKLCKFKGFLAMFLSQIMDIHKCIKYVIYNNLYSIKLTFISQYYDIGLYTLKPPFSLAEIS